MKKGLGKGLGALLTSEEDVTTGVTEMRINDIEPNMGQPRKKFDDEKLMQLSESIKQHGVVQPIIVRKENNGYKIIAGERRWRAARLAGLNVVPVVIKDISDKQVMEIALIENLQREDLNPIEEAEAYEKLISEYKMTQEEISNTVGKSRSAVANSLRLLNLNEKIREYLIEGALSSGHARALLSIEDNSVQISVAEEIIKRELNVRDTEKMVKQILSRKPAKKEKKMSEEYRDLEENFKEIFGTKVKLLAGNKKGKILIEYYSNEELERIVDIVNSIKK